MPGQPTRRVVTGINAQGKSYFVHDGPTPGHLDLGLAIDDEFGISPLEAMQSNVPVIISNQSGVAEILTYAVKVDYWDIEAMADAIYGLLNYKGAHEFFKQYGREEV